VSGAAAPKVWGRQTTIAALSLLLSACLVGGCFQELDPGISSGTARAAARPDGGHTTSITTPPIALNPNDAGQVTTRACDRTTQQAIAILTDTCASCHGGRAPGENKGQPPFDFLFDFQRLVTARSASVADPANPSLGMRFVIPGDPDHSRLYLMVVSTPPEMPPASAAASPLPMPTVSDMSILQSWIAGCLPAPLPDGADAGPARDGGGG